MPVDTLRALEAGTAPATDVATRAYLRMYARFLDMDAEALLRSIDGAPPLASPPGRGSATVQSAGVGAAPAATTARRGPSGPASAGAAAGAAAGASGEPGAAAGAAVRASGDPEAAARTRPVPTDAAGAAGVAGEAARVRPGPAGAAAVGASADPGTGQRSGSVPTGGRGRRGWFAVALLAGLVVMVAAGVVLYGLVAGQPTIRLFSPQVGAGEDADAAGAGDAGARADAGDAAGAGGTPGLSAEEGTGPPGTASTDGEALTPPEPSGTDAGGDAAGEEPDAAGDAGEPAGEEPDAGSDAGSPALRPPEETRVQILHNAAPPAVIDDVRATLESLGYRVVQVNSARMRFSRTTVFHVEGWDAEARQLRDRDARFAAVEDNPRFSSEVDLHVAIGPDWSAGP